MCPWRLYKDNVPELSLRQQQYAGTTPTVNGNGQYILYVATGEASAVPRGNRLDRCSSKVDCKRLSGNSQNDGYIALPPSFVGNAAAFDNIHLQRQGDQITVWVNDVLMFTLTDGTYVSNQKWGVFILPYTNDSLSHPSVRRRKLTSTTSGSTRVRPYESRRV
jgi:hypothetical protein